MTTHPFKWLVVVDPGKHTGVAGFEDGKLAYSHELKNITSKEIYNLLWQYQTKPNQARLVIENQLKGCMGGSSFATLVRDAQRWVTVAELFGIGYERLYPASWQSFYTPPKGVSGRSRKRWLWELAKGYFGPSVGPNECDALLMGRYYLEVTRGRSSV